MIYRRKLGLVFITSLLFTFLIGGIAFSQGSSGTIVKKAYVLLNEGYYIAEGVVTVENGIVVDCTIDEINTMLFWANFNQNKITKDEIAAFGEENTFTAMFDFHGEVVPTKFAKYVQVGDRIFEAGHTAKGYILYKSEETGDVIPFFEKSDGHMEWFFKEMRAGNFWFLKKKGAGFEKFEIASFFKDVPGKPLEKGKSQNKKYRVHWNNWEPNIYKIELFLKRNGFIKGTFVVNKDKIWTVADAVTGATITEFPEYAGVLYEAYEK
ncbi:hypothetical protein TRIP_E230061 [uncultured Spirochaetota bacterium]|uniref:Uncharacterized protein n=1 Tax=uncultured Spirochaetota bacterium TaxID=460511 RepID=A0A652ZVQ0_9SPIR|nr:hypothetical protein TRIP_E230061 [uncultured Spirochaetota bacterium]